MWEAIVANSKRLYNWATNPAVETVKEYYDKTSPLIQQAYDQQTSGQNSSPEVNAIAGIAAIGEVASIGGATQGPNPGPAGENLAKLAGQVSLDAQARRHGVPGGWQGLMDQLNPPPTPAPNKGKPGVGTPFRGGEQASPPRRWDPLVLDLDGGGVQLVQLENSTAYFDLNQDGFREHVGWVGPNEGLLVDDKNRDNVVNDGSELFGDETTSGFTILAALDSDNNGIINNLDSEFQHLKIWTDTNSDGISQNGEIKSLSELSIAAINLSITAVQNPANHVTHIFEKATFVKNDGSSLEIADAFFEQDLSETVYSGPIVVSPAAAVLPDIRGYGLMPNLQTAASINPSLIDKYQILNNSNGYAEFRANTVDLLMAWTGSSDIDPDSRGAFDARKLHAMETYLGRTFVNTSSGTEVAFWSVPFLEEAWQAMLEQYESRLLVLGGPLKTVFPNATYGAQADELILNSNAYELGFFLKAVKEDSSDLKFDDLLKSIQSVMANSRDMWNQSITFLDASTTNYIDETTGKSFIVGTGGSDTISAIAAEGYINAGDGSNSISTADGNYLNP